MMRSILLLAVVVTLTTTIHAFSIESSSSSNKNSRRAFLTKSTTGTIATAATILLPTTTTTLLVPEPANAATTPEILKTSKGVKYAITKAPKDKAVYPQEGDFVVVEYTGYLSNGQIFDATHSEGKSNALLFKLGSTAVITGLNDIVSNMRVGEKVQAIIPPELAFADVGVCLDNGECLIKPGSTLVYDVLLKKTSIPPP
jgi:FKBP-type peptidyl-prolyl cis-trans isomerase